MKNGINLYRFNYKGDRGVYEGVMAQDVQTTFGATTWMPNGFMGVYYDILGMKMKYIGNGGED